MVFDGVVCGYYWWFGITKYKFVIKEIVEHHGDGGGKTKDAGGFYEIVVKWNVQIGKNIKGKFVDWSNKTKEPGKKWTDGNGGETVPEKEHNDTTFGNMAFFPGDFGVKNIGENGSKSIGNDTI